MKVGVFWKVTERGLVRRSWVEGSEERIWKPSLRICFEIVNARIVSGDKRQVVGVSEGGGVRVVEAME